MGPFYTSYGLYLIKKYPFHFLRYFVLPNSQKYLLPPVEYLGNYNWGHSTVPESAVKWFGYKNGQVTTRMKTGKVWILNYYPTLVCFTNLLMLLGLLSYVFMKGWQDNPTFNKCILLGGFAWIANAGFTIFLASAALRYQAFSALLGVTFSVLLIDWMARLMQRIKHESQQQQPAGEYAQKAEIIS